MKKYAEEEMNELISIYNTINLLEDSDKEKKYFLYKMMNDVICEISYILNRDIDILEKDIKSDIEGGK